MYEYSFTLVTGSKLILLMVNTISSIGRSIKIEHVYHFGQGYPGITSYKNIMSLVDHAIYKLHIYKHMVIKLSDKWTVYTCDYFIPGARCHGIIIN